MGIRNKLRLFVMAKVNAAAMRRWLGGVAVAIPLALTPAAATYAASGKTAKSVKSGKAAKSVKTAAYTRDSRASRTTRPSKRAAGRVVRAAVVLPSMGHISGLQHTDDALELKSSVALVIDQDTNEVLFSKNPNAVLPIASITKLMTGLVVTEAHLPLDEKLTVSAEDVAATAGSRSRLLQGTELTRGEMMHLALMSSENRAAHVLGRTYPGGLDAFIPAMNAKARQLGMGDTRYVEPTGLSSSNQSSAQDLARLVRAAFEHPILRDLSTSPEAMVPVGRHNLQFRNTNGLVRSPEWEIGLQKTGYISAAGRCLVMQAQLAGRKLIMVLLDSAGKYSRIGDAERIRHWLVTTPLATPLASAGLPQAR